METSSKALEDLQELLSRDASLQQRMLQASDMASATRYLLDAACAHGLALSQQDINTALSQAAKEAQAIPTQELEELERFRPDWTQRGRVGLPSGQGAATVKQGLREASLHAC